MCKYRFKTGALQKPQIFGLLHSCNLLLQQTKGKVPDAESTPQSRCKGKG